MTGHTVTTEVSDAGESRILKIKYGSSRTEKCSPTIFTNCPLWIMFGNLLEVIDLEKDMNELTMIDSL